MKEKNLIGIGKYMAKTVDKSFKKLKLKTTIKKNKTQHCSSTEMDVVRETDITEHCKRWRNWKFHASLMEMQNVRLHFFFKFGSFFKS